MLLSNRLTAAVLGFTLAVLSSAAWGRATQTEPTSDPTASAPFTSAAAPAQPTVSVQLIADGETRTVSAPEGSTVGNLLSAEHLVLGALDRCSLRPNIILQSNMQVRVARVKIKETVVRTPVPFSTRRKYVGSLPVGQKKVATPGTAGARIAVFRDVYKDAARTERRLLRQSLVPARAQVEIVGTRGMTLASRGYFGGRRMIEMVATGYGPGDNGKWGNRTASGLRPGFGVVAVDPRFIPLGTRLYVEGYGYAVAGDTGGAIKGARIDLGHDTHSAAEAVGRRRVRVLILD